MASGSFSGSAVNGQDPYIFWSYTQDVATRKTTLTLTLKIKRLDNNYSTNKANAPYNIQCPNNTVAKSGTFNYDITDVSVGSYLTIGSVVKTLQHGTDGVYGSGSITVEGQLDLTGTSVGDLTTGVGTIIIPDIPVESDVASVTGNTIGGTLGIILDAASTGFTHNLTYAFGALTGTIVNGLTGSLAPSYNWNTSALRDAMIQESPSSASKALTITCKTYSGSTLLGTTTKVVTLYVPTDAVPTISGVSNEDALQILGASLKTWYVQSKSKPKVLFQCAGYLGSTIVSRELKINGIVVSNALVGSFYEGTALSPIAFSSGNTYQITVTDSRGKTATTGDVAISQVAAYSIPGFTSCLIQRCLQDGTLNGDGTWLKITPDWYFSSVIAASVARNAITTKNWKIGTGANTAFASADGVSFVVSNGTPSGADGKFSINSSYLITVTITDTLGSSGVFAVTISSAKRLFSLNAEGTGVAIGKAAEIAATNFECDLPAKFNSTVQITGALTAPVANGSQVGLVPAPGTANDNKLLHINASDILEYSNLSEVIHAAAGFVGSAAMTSSDELPLVAVGSPSTENKTNMGAIFDYIAKSIDTTASGTDGNTDDNKKYFHFGDLCIQWGRVAITPSAAGTPTGKSVTFPVAFNSIPVVVVGLQSLVPGSTVTGWSCTTPSTTAVTIYVTRNNTTATALYWIAVGYKA